MQDVSIHISDLHKSIAPRLNELIESAVRLRMAVAYWTIRKDYLSNNLVNLLSKEDSFACVDLSYPTKVSEICDLSRHGANTYFYLRKIEKDNSSPDRGVELHLGGHLLHSKVFLFDLPDGKASIWIGSHNWTDRALSGINIETSIEIKTAKDGPVYKQIESLLRSIKNKCHKVNSDLEEIYKNIQRRENTLFYLHSAISNLQEALLMGQLFHLLGVDRNRLNDFYTDRKFVLFLSEKIDDKSGYICEAQVSKSGLLPKIDPSLNWPNFESGYWSLQSSDGSYSEFKPFSDQGRDEELKASFYVTISPNYETLRRIQNIDIELSNYKPVVDVPQLQDFVHLEELIEGSPWPQSQRKSSIIFQEPQIFSPNASDYKSPPVPGKVTKVVKSKGGGSKQKDSEQPG